MELEFEKNEEEAIKKVAIAFSMSPDNKKEVIEKALKRQADDPRVLHDLGFSKRMFAQMWSRYKGLRTYICTL